MSNELYFDAFHKDELNRYEIAADGKRKYLQKGYLHLDRRIWYPDYAEKFRRFIINSDKVATMRFKPLLHVILNTRRFRPDDKGVRRIELKPRPIAYAGHFDALVYSFYNTVLSTLYEQYVIEHRLKDCVLAYRKLGWNNVHFARDSFHHIRQRGECTAIAMDVKGFFDNLDHEELKAAWVDVLKVNPKFTESRLPGDHYNLYRSLTRYSFIGKRCILKTLGLKDKELGAMQQLCDDAALATMRSLIMVNNGSCGIPQGTPISAVLSNIYMTSFDKAMCAHSGDNGWYYRRYCDDVLLVCAPAELPAAERIISELLVGLKLKINGDKTDRVHFRLSPKGELRGFKYEEPEKFKNLQYLGLEFSGQRSYIRSASVSRYHRRMKCAVGEAVKRTLGKNSKGSVVGRKNLNSRYLDLSQQNFPAYAPRAEMGFNEAGFAHGIGSQLRNNCMRLKMAVRKKTADRIVYLQRKAESNSVKKNSQCHQKLIN